MQEVYVKVREFDTIEEIHEHLMKELDFPSYYGKNLSALYDVLTDISDDTKIILDLADITDEELLDAAERMMEVITDASDENEYLEAECLE